MANLDNSRTPQHTYVRYKQARSFMLVCICWFAFAMRSETPMRSALREQRESFRALSHQHCHAFGVGRANTRNTMPQSLLEETCVPNMIYTTNHDGPVLIPNILHKMMCAHLTGYSFQIHLGALDCWTSGLEQFECVLSTYECMSGLLEFGSGKQYPYLQRPEVNV